MSEIPLADRIETLTCAMEREVEPSRPSPGLDGASNARTCEHIPLENVAGWLRWGLQTSPGRELPLENVALELSRVATRARRMPSFLPTAQLMLRRVTAVLTADELVELLACPLCEVADAAREALTDSMIGA